jgi:hypothetical protein
MVYFPSQPPPRRAPRTWFAETTPAVLRCQDGRRVRGKLHIISLTGGLLWLSTPLDQGARVKLMFLTRRGSVLGAAEMLSPVSWRLQPFKFVKLYDDDELRLQTAIQSSLDRNHHGHGQMERYRAW